MEAASSANISDPRAQLTLCLNVLREYAKWCLLHGYVPPAESERRRTQLLPQLFEIGPELNLTERDIVWLLFHEVLTPRT